MSYNSDHLHPTASHSGEKGYNNNQTVHVGKMRNKGKRQVLTSETLLHNFQLEEKNDENIRRKLNSGAQQKPAFRMLDEAVKNVSKTDRNITESQKSNTGTTKGDNQGTTLNTDNSDNLSYSFSVNRHLDQILNNQKQSKTTIKPPTVKLTSIEMGIAPDSSNPFVPSRRELNRKLTKLAKSKQRDISFIEKKKLTLRAVGEMAWEDNNLLDFDPNDFRMFVGDLGHEVTDEMLRSAFNHYPSVQRVRVIKNPRARKNKGYGFVSFKDPNDYLKAMKEMNGRYIGVRPIKCRKSCWKDRSLHFITDEKEKLKNNGYRT